MSRSLKYSSEFLDDLERRGKIGSYCAEDSAYIEWLEHRLDKHESALAETVIEFVEKHLKIPFDKSYQWKQLLEGHQSGETI